MSKNKRPLVNSMRVFSLIEALASKFLGFHLFAWNGRGLAPLPWLPTSSPKTTTIDCPISQFEGPILPGTCSCWRKPGKWLVFHSIGRLCLRFHFVQLWQRPPAKQRGRQQRGEAQWGGGGSKLRRRPECCVEMFFFLHRIYPRLLYSTKTEMIWAEQ